MIINVTADHIARGKHGNFFKCPVALAINEATKNKSSVGQYHIYMMTKNGVIKNMFITPEFVATFINRFDTNKPVEPFSFDLDIP